MLLMRIELVNDYVDLPRIKKAWGTLCDELHESATVFYSYEWFETCCRHQASDLKLNIITMWDAEKLVGIAPLMVRRVTVHGLPAKSICFIENNQWLHNDFIVLPFVRELFLCEVLKFLFEHGAYWDLVVLKNFSNSSENYSTLVKILEKTGKTWRQNPTAIDSPFIIPGGTWETYLANRTARTRKSLRNIQNNIQKEGEVSLKNIRTKAEFLVVKNEVFSVAKQSWAEKHHEDSLASAANTDFFNDLAIVAAEKGWLSLWTLNLNGKIAAIEFHLKAYGKEHAMRGHYLPEFASLSPGTYLEMKILENAFDEAQTVRLYDFGGSFESYKRKWTENYVPHCNIEIFGNSIYSQVIKNNELRLIPLLKRILPQSYWNNKLFKSCGINTNRVVFK